MAQRASILFVATGNFFQANGELVLQGISKVLLDAQQRSMHCQFSFQCIHCDCTHSRRLLSVTKWIPSHDFLLVSRFFDEVLAQRHSTSGSCTGGPWLKQLMFVEWPERSSQMVLQSPVKGGDAQCATSERRVFLFGEEDCAESWRVAEYKERHGISSVLHFSLNGPLQLGGWYRRVPIALLFQTLVSVLCLRECDASGCDGVEKAPVVSGAFATAIEDRILVPTSSSGFILLGKLGCRTLSNGEKLFYATEIADSVNFLRSVSYLHSSACRIQAEFRVACEVETQADPFGYAAFPARLGKCSLAKADASAGEASAEPSAKESPSLWSFFATPVVSFATAYKAVDICFASKLLCSVSELEAISMASPVAVEFKTALTIFLCKAHLVVVAASENQEALDDSVVSYLLVHFAMNDADGEDFVVDLDAMKAKNFDWILERVQLRFTNLLMDDRSISPIKSPMHPVRAVESGSSQSQSRSRSFAEILLSPASAGLKKRTRKAETPTKRQEAEFSFFRRPACPTVPDTPIKEAERASDQQPLSFFSAMATPEGAVEEIVIVETPQKILRCSKKLAF